MTKTAEHQRLLAHRHKIANWRDWGPYLSDRAWGTVREDYSADGNAWAYFPQAQARMRVYRWNEDGLAGISDRNQFVCFALALWNGRDSILKERLFGLNGHEGNHAEDVKELYYYLDNTPTHSYMKMLYKYPQAPFPYAKLREENARRTADDPEYEIMDTGVFDDDRYFDVFVEYAKADTHDILIRITAHNRGADPAPLYLLPTIWYRNTWSWGYPNGPQGMVSKMPYFKQGSAEMDVDVIEGEHEASGGYWLYAEGADELLFTNNDTNTELLYGYPNVSPFVKDGFHRYLIDEQKYAVNPDKMGTKAAAEYYFMIEGGDHAEIRLRLTNVENTKPFFDFEHIFDDRKAEADAFYAEVQRPDLNDDERNVQRQAFAGMLWSKQLYYYDMQQWQKGDPAYPPPPPRQRNQDWEHLTNFDVISMPDKWEYPWYATWDLAFHCVTLAMIDPDFAKRQMTLITREWYMHPNGQFPAYEWAFGDTNPPVPVWAIRKIYNIDKEQRARDGDPPDTAFLEGLYHKLLLNFTWWVNKKDADGNNVFQGGFLGLDNISIFDRSHMLPTGGHIDQSDGSAWMAFYCLEMMRIALYLAEEQPVYQDTATKFFEHFLRIAHAMTDCGGSGVSLWDDEDGFFYDVLHMPNGAIVPLKVRSIVGLLPLLAVETLEDAIFDDLTDFNRRSHWFIENRPHLAGKMADIDRLGQRDRHLMALVTPEKLTSVLRYMLDEDEFFSPYGIRSLSKVHETEPYTFTVNGYTSVLRYQPAESDTTMFGGNSNWRGPVWFPVNYVIIEALYEYYDYYGDSFTVECPTGSGNFVTLDKVADEISRRLVRLFLRDDKGKRPVYGDSDKMQNDPRWRDYILFYEYFHGDNGTGLGASHQTGWTGLVANLIQQCGGDISKD